MKKIFLDSSVLVAACASLEGASSYILGLCKKKKLKGYVSRSVLGEAKKNVELKLGKEGRKRLLYFLKFANLYLISEASPEEIALCEEVINEKDAPILASFLKSPASYLVTLDKKHFLTPPVVSFAKKLVIITPGNFLRKFIRKE